MFHVFDRHFNLRNDADVNLVIFVGENFPHFVGEIFLIISDDPKIGAGVE